MSRYFGVDLAWGEGTAAKAAKETGLALIDDAGSVLEAGWARGIDEVVVWLSTHAQPGDVIAIDAPLVVTNETGMRECERQVAQRYGSWNVYANPSNLGRAWFGGITLRERLEALGFFYVDGTRPAPDGSIQFFECYPYTMLVGAAVLGYDDERPRYKRANLSLPPAERKAFRAAECDGLIDRLSRLVDHKPALNLKSHPVTAALTDSPSPIQNVEYKHREDLLDATLCAWTAALWSQQGVESCQLLGANDSEDANGRRPVIIAPARPEQREGAARKARPRSVIGRPRATVDGAIDADHLRAQVEKTSDRDVLLALRRALADTIDAIDQRLSEVNGT